MKIDIAYQKPYEIDISYEIPMKIDSPYQKPYEIDISYENLHENKYSLWK